MELNTYGDLKKVIKAIALKQKGEKIGNVALGTLMGFIPGAETAKTTFDFIKAAISKPDTKKTKTWLDKLDIDDEMSAIVDDTVENGFMQMMSKTIESKPDTQQLEPDFNMNAKMVKYLEDKYEGRTVAGIQENKNKNKMENKILKNIIKEEIKNILLENEPTLKGAANLKPLISQLPGVEINDFMIAFNNIKANRALNLNHTKAMAAAMVGLIKSDDDQLLNKIMAQLKILGSK
jgi:hypothetical protein